MRNYIWICGPSAIGKKYFMDNLKESEELHHRFGVIGLLESYMPINNDEEKEIEKIESIRAQFVLLKWQYRTHPLVSKLRVSHPAGSQKGIILWMPEEKHYEYFKKKHGSNPTFIRGQQLSEEALREKCRNDRRSNYERLTNEWPREIECEIVNASLSGFPRMESLPNN